LTTDVLKYIALSAKTDKLFFIFWRKVLVKILNLSILILASFAHVLPVSANEHDYQNQQLYYKDCNRHGHCREVKVRQRTRKQVIFQEYRQQNYSSGYRQGISNYQIQNACRPGERAEFKGYENNGRARVRCHYNQH
jgi:hypothetical protein